MTLIERLADEADLCRNEGADDIAALLDEARTALAEAEQSPGDRARAHADRICGAAEAEKAQPVAAPAGWRETGPVTQDHPLECLIVVEALRQSDGDWWVRGDHFLGEHQPIAWLPDNDATRAMLAASPTAPAQVPQPLSGEQRQALVTNWFAEDWAIDKAIGLLHDYEVTRGITGAKP